MHRFYCNIKERGGVLSEEETFHAINVLRIQENDQVICFDGLGTIWNCNISKIFNDKRNPRVILTINSEEYTPSRVELAKPKLILICSLFKFDRFEWGLEKVTEIGIDEIVITKTRYSQYDLSVASKKILRWKEITVSASKQCGRNWLPEISVSEYTSLLKSESDICKYLATTEISTGKKIEKKSEGNIKEYHLFIGPEGGFDSKEISELQQFYEPITLGENILRAETAMIVGSAKLTDSIS